jgi:signal transduction histidine kinase/CheY-like chemotaxis protein
VRPLGPSLPTAQQSAQSGLIQSVFVGGGEMGELIRSKDWSASPLGAIASWPNSLKTAVNLMLASGFAMVVAWGADFRFFYNDRYRPVLGVTKHPTALGTAAKEIFPEAWHFIGPLFESTRRGESVALDDVLIPLKRYGYLENCYFLLSYSPIRDETGEVAGMLAVVAETTERVQSERRMKTLRDLARKASENTSVPDAIANAAAILGENPVDVPFSLFYRVERNGKQAKLEAVTGVDSGSTAVPECIDLDEPSSAGWPVTAALNNSELIVVDDLPQRFGKMPGGPYPEPAHTAVVRALSRPGQPFADCILICGVSPRRALDDQYRGFYELAADHVLTGIRNAVAWQEERERLEKLVQIDRAKTLFFSNVSHEFRTPLTLMLGPLEEMISVPGERLSVEDRKQLTVVHRNSLRLLKLVNTLLDFSRIEAGRVQAVYEPTDLAQLTNELASNFRSAIEKAGLFFNVNCPTLPGPVYVDRDMWEKIVLNLLSNAFKFTFTGGIQVELKSTDTSVELSVSDTGTGIPEHELTRVFERFHRIEGAAGRTHEGTGIGLALVQELAKLNGGVVRVSSRLNQGSTFVVSLPTGTAHVPPDRIETQGTLGSTLTRPETYLEEARLWAGDDLSQVDPASMFEGDSLLHRVKEEAASREAVIVADDNADMRSYISRLLDPHYLVFAARDGVEALEAIRNIRPSLVITDVMMPRLDGFGVLNAIRTDADLKAIPVILLSARAGEESRVEGLHAGADDYLEKPFTARELLARVVAHVNLARVRREAAGQESRLRAVAEQERKRLQQLLAQAPAAIGLLSGPEHRWVYVNNDYVRLTGRDSGDDFIGRTVAESLPEIRTQALIGFLDEVYRTGDPYLGHEMKIVLNRSAKGLSDECYWDFVYQPVRDDDGTVEGILVHAVEVTDRVLARRAIEASEKKYRELAETATIGLHWVGPDGTILWANQAELDMLGYVAEEYIGHNIKDFHFDEPVICDILDRLSNGKRLRDYEASAFQVFGSRMVEPKRSASLPIWKYSNRAPSVFAANAASSAAISGVFVPRLMPYRHVHPLASRNPRRFLTASGVTL